MNLSPEKPVRKALAAAFPHTLPVMAGFLFLGTAYGVLMQQKGYGALWSGLMSAIAFCGSMQFAAVGLLTSVFNPYGAFSMSLLVNARHLFYGVSLLDKYRGTGAKKPFLIFWLCDETFSITSSVEVPPGIEKGWFYFFVSLLNYLYWQIGTFAGSALGELLSMQLEGLDFVLTALFVVLFLEQWKNKEARPSCVAGVGCALIALLIFGEENFVIPAMVLLLATLLIGRKRKCN